MGDERLLDRELEDLPPDLRWREWMLRVEAVIFATAELVSRETLARVVGKSCSIDLLIDDLREEIRSRPYDMSRSPKASSIVAVRRMHPRSVPRRRQLGRIEITKVIDGLEVSGEAQWFGLTNQFGEQVVHDGALYFIAKPVNSRLVLRVDSDYLCAAELIHIGRLFVVRDNGYCGGANVRFNGVYRRKK